MIRFYFKYKLTCKQCVRGVIKSKENIIEINSEPESIVDVCCENCKESVRLYIPDINWCMSEVKEPSILSYNIVEHYSSSKLPLQGLFSIFKKTETICHESQLLIIK